MKKLTVYLCLLFLLLPTAAMASYNEDTAKKQFCTVKEFMAKNKAFVTTFNAISTTMSLTGGILAAMVRFEAERKMLEKGMKSTTITLKASKPAFVGPLKASGSTMIPFMDKSSKLIDEAELSSKTAVFYNNVYTPASYAMLAAKIGLYGTQTAGIALCNKGTLLGVEIKRKQAVEAGKKFIAIAKKYQSRINNAVNRCSSLKSAVMPLSGTFSSLNSALNTIKSPVYALEKAVKAINKRMKPVFSLSDKLIKELKKNRCITYSVKVKVKKKVWKTKTKKQKFCFKFYTLVRTYNKMSKVVEKPVKDIFKKTIEPIINKLMKEAKKGMGLDKMSKFENKFSSLKSKLSSFTGKLKAAAALKTDAGVLNSATRELNGIRP